MLLPVPYEIILPFEWMEQTSNGIHKPSTISKYRFMGDMRYLGEGYG